MTTIRPLSGPLAKIAKVQLNEVPSRIPEDLQTIKTWISKQPHLRPINDDQLLISFLRGCKYSLERTKEKIDKHFRIKTNMPEIFGERDPNDPNILKILRSGTILVLPKPAKSDDPITILIRPGCYAPREFTPADLIKIHTMIADVLIRDNDNFVIGGEVVLYDFLNAGWSHIIAFDVTSLKNLIAIVEDAMPIRMKGIHFYRPPTGFETFVNLVKSLLNEKNKDRLMMHGDSLESVYKCIPKKMLPTEYGGEAGSIQDIIDDWEKKLIDSKDYFIEIDKYRSNEAKRVREGVVSGSFRKLDVD